MTVLEQMKREDERIKRIEKRRRAFWARAEARPPCRICGGRMSDPRNGLSRCQGNEFIACGGLRMRRSEAYKWLKATGITGRPLDYFTFTPDSLHLPIDSPESDLVVDGHTLRVLAEAEP